jgi:hypothetical protein
MPGERSIMKTYIPKQPKYTKERIETKLDARLVRQLEQYCQYLESDRDYVLSQVLGLIFRKDRGFTEWLASKNMAAPAEIVSARPEETGRRVRIGGTE